MKKYAFLICIVMLSVLSAFADPISIKNFAVKENPFGKDELAIVATDTAGVIQEGINGTFKFSINGFDEDLAFEHGTALYHRKLYKSSFLYVKHSDDAGSNSILYYIFKQDAKLTPVRISWIVLIAIPCILILLGYMFRKLIILAIVLFCLFVYFNHHSGLDIGTFFETVFDGIKHLFSKSF
ncbi:hypothetical protein [uncultured Mucilaginibacter sp.]|uniref:hypothetical protein n=1 Tax=uncultured Mucilaginibacter sp. TaxID=797541 RepID=UPI0025F36F90|nr:hypothetical protein [uncultured Mucilaginibacter sp.]